MIRVRCFRCKSDLDAPGAILLSPRDSNGRAIKRHLCTQCFEVVAFPHSMSCCEMKRDALLLSPPDNGDRVTVTRFCVRHYLKVLRGVGA